MPSAFKHIFTPHHSNNHRPKLIQFQGLSILIALVLLTHSSLNLIQANPPRGLILGYASNITSDQVLEQTNQERAKLGLPPLELNSKLTEAALAKAADMFQKDYWSHTAPDGTTPWNFIRGAGYSYSVAGENLARDFNDTPSMVTAWMNSPTHRANIVHAKYTEAGIAVVDGVLGGIETTLVVHMFGVPSTLSSTAQITPGTSQQTKTPALATPQITSSVLADVHTPEVTKFHLSPLKVRESFALAVITLLILILALDEIIIRNRKTIRFVGKNFAHLSFLGALLIIVITLSRQGGIL